jgi:NTE family protein
MKIGIALGGGGSKGFAHLGVLKALGEKGIRPDIIAGTSAGSIVGAFIAAGKEPEEILELIKKNRFIDFAKVTLPGGGFFTLGNFEKLMEKLLPAREFSDLQLPFYASATNLYTGKVEYLSKGPLIPAVKASCAIPVLFLPVTLHGQLYADGGVLDNLPVTPLVSKCDKIIAVNVNKNEEVKRLGNIKEAALRVFEIISNRDRDIAEDVCDLLIEPPGLGKFRILDTRHADELFEIGYEHTRKIEVPSSWRRREPLKSFKLYRGKLKE